MSLRSNGGAKALKAVWLLFAVSVCLAVSIPAAIAAGPATLVDAGFENGTEGAALVSPPWTLSGVPQHAEYDDAHAKAGTMSGWIQGPSAAAVGGVSVPAVMTADGSEYRFWVNFDTTNQNRYFTDTGSVWEFRANTSGQLLVYTKRSATGYAPNAWSAVGTYATGWTEYRVLCDFTADTYTLSQRAEATDPWTELKSAGAATYDIPMREASDRTTTGNLLFRGYQGSSMWLDEVRYGDGGIGVIRTHTLTYTANANGAITGDSPQVVNDGDDGAPVTAVPDAGYHFVAWSDGVTENPRTDTDVTADKSVSATFEIDRFSLDYSNNPFDTAPVLASTKTAGAWYTDRFAPAAFEKAAFDGGDRLHVGISAADFQAADFYNTQGRNFDLTDAKSVKADLYVGADWETENRRADLWAVGVDSLGSTTGWPVIGFVNGTGFRVWDNNGWHTVGFPSGFTYGKWYSLKMMLNPTSVTYYIDDKIVFTSTFTDDPAMGDAVKFGSLILQAKNFNNSYDVYWDNVSSTNVDPHGSVTGATSQVVDYGADGTPVTAAPAAGYHFVRWSDGSTANPRTDTNVTEDKAVTAIFGIDRFSLDYSNNTFATAPVLAATKTAGAWYTDRFAPAAFEKAAFDGGDRLHVGISTADFQATDFYNTQGRKFDLTSGKLAQADLYVGADWETENRRADLWATAVGIHGAPTGYPIIGFLNGEGFRVWDNNGWHTVGFPTGFTYGKWYSLKMKLNPTSVTYYIDGNLVYTSTFTDDPEMANAVKFDNLILQAKNFNNSYDVYWDNVSATNVDPHGSVTGDDPQYVGYGTDGTAVTAVPATGYHFVGWSDGSTANPRTDTNVTDDQSVSATFEIDRFSLDYLDNPFDTAPVLAAAKTAGAWYTDRYAPAAFEKAAFDGGDRLHVAISSADFQAADFYNTQGRKFDLTDAKSVKADLYVGADFESETRRADLWTTAVDSAGGITGYPIIGFVNGTGFRVWDNNEWHTVGFPSGFAYGKWYSLKMMLNPTSVTYYIDDKLAFTSTFVADPEMAGAVKFDNLMLQAKNFNNSYDVYWDNVSATNVDPHGSVTGASPQVVTYGADGTAVTAVPAPGYSFVQWSDGSTANPRTDTNVTADKSVRPVFEAAEVTVPVVIGSSRLTDTGMTATTDQHQLGSGAWHFAKPGGASKAEFYLVPSVDFGTTFTVADIESITYNTYNHGNAAPVEFFVALYTEGTEHGWYGQRLNSEPYLKSGTPYVPVLDGWQSWTTAGAEALTFFDSNNCGNIGFYGAPTMEQLQAGPIDWSTWAGNPTQATSSTTPIDYAAQGVKYITFQTGSGWTEFDGYLDGISVALKNGTTYEVDLEATP